ncbi:hypothetical protein ACRPHS_01190 [Pantoea allii]|uniref:hypothetical protein n=1 Tax=Pantoea allii TaxID=574096 RepID=UPI0015606500|nr:hypothetical protein [Pantoea allii]NQS84635.1 hypothetical protein [Pantoea allii]
MNIRDRIIQKIDRSPDDVFLRDEFSTLGGHSQVNKFLNELVRMDVLHRPGKGIYAKKNALKKNDSNRLIELLNTIFKKLSIPVSDIQIKKQSGERFFLVNPVLNNVSRKIEVDGIPVKYKKTSQDRSRKLYDEVLLSVDVDLLPTVNVKHFIEKLAVKYHIKPISSGLDGFAETITSLAGDDIKLDVMEKTLVSLKKNNYITGPQMARLLTNYLKEE